MYVIGLDNIHAAALATFEPGALGWTHDNRGWIYGQAQEAIAKHLACYRWEGNRGIYGCDNSTNKGAVICVSPHDVAQNEWAWFQIWGDALVTVAPNCAANVALSTTTTLGRLDDAAAGQNDVLDTGIFLTTARGTGAGTAPCFLNWPRALEA